MHALYIGSTDPNSCALFYAEALAALGAQVTHFDPKYFQANSFLQKAHIKLLKAPLRRIIDEADEKLLDLAKKHSFDLVLVIAENFLSDETITEFKRLQKNNSRFFYHSHDNNFSDGILKPATFWKTLKAYDFVFTTKSQNVSRYKALGQAQSIYIPSAYEPKSHRPIPDSESHLKGQKFEVSFIGTYDQSRDPVFDILDWEPLHIWGNNWTRSRHYSEHANHITPHAIYGFEYADVTSHSQISLGLLREEAEDQHTQRTFEIPACGSFQIAPRNEEILQYFKEDKEIVCFDSLSELKDKVDYYSKHSSERKKIAKAGFDRVKKDGHTYEDRVKTMLEHSGLLLKKKRAAT